VISVFDDVLVAMMLATVIVKLGCAEMTIWFLWALLLTKWSQLY
jgi:hypothetical protein